MKKITARLRRQEEKMLLVDRFDANPNEGLSHEQVQLRISQGLTNKTKQQVSKSYSEIIFTNIFSFFNILLFLIAGAMVWVKYYGGLFFLVILFANMFIGLIQDIRAKKTVERLRLVTAPTAFVIRDGKTIEISTDDLVLDDIMVLSLGKQISSDSIVLSGQIRTNEALLTGESVPVKKEEGSQVYAGTYVTSGSAICRVDRVGKTNYIQQLQTRAKAFKRPKSQLLSSINSLFKTIGGLVIIIGLLMVLGNIYQQIGIEENVKRVSGSLVSMIPTGMYLLTSMTLAVGVLRLAEKRALVQEMYSIEMLARVDVLCLDKTGTLTDGTMAVHEVYRFPKYELEDLDTVMGSFVKVNTDTNGTIQALKDHYPQNDAYEVETFLPFSSEKKVSGVTFKKRGSFILGASNFILGEDLDEEISQLEQKYMERGFRVVLLAYSKKPIEGEDLPKKLEPFALFVIQDHVRSDAAATIRWFKDNGVQIKIISGDHPTTVGEISKEVGVLGAEHPINLAGVSNEDVKAYASEYSVFGRVTPEQKELIIQSLKEQGKTVAMVGDGVNDILSLKHADCSIAMAAGSEAATNVSHLVLMDSNFAALPAIVEEGRRVINNLQRTWSLFLVKTIFSILMSIFFLAATLLAPSNSGVAYPFTTQNMYVWEIASIGVPAFFLALQPNKAQIKGTFMGNVFLKALPAGITIFIFVLTFFMMRMYESINPNTTGVMTEKTAITMAVITMIFISFMVLFRLSLPLNKYRAILFASLFTVAGLVLLVSELLHINAFDVDYSLLTKQNIQELLLVNLIAIPVYYVLDRAMAGLKVR